MKSLAQCLIIAMTIAIVVMFAAFGYGAAGIPGVAVAWLILFVLYDGMEE